MVKYSFIIPTLERDVSIVEETKKLRKSVYSIDYEYILATELGKARCRNIAATKTEGRYLIFIDGDSWCDSNVLIWMMDWITKHHNDYLCYPHSINRFCCSRILVISKKQFYRLHGFNEIFNESIDVDFGIRALRAGIKVHYIPRAWINHIEHEKNKFVEQVRRPFERMRMVATYPSDFWTIYARRRLRRILLIFVRQDRALRKPFGLWIPINLITKSIMFLISLVLIKVRPSFKSSLI